MTLYAESSAILAWLLDEGPADEIRATLGSAELVFSSDLTLIECERGLIQARARGRINESQAISRASQLRQTSHHWVCLSLDPGIASRASAPFPNEPIRTLDALHVAFALATQSLVSDTRILSLDRRIRESAELMGIGLLPPDQSA